MDFADDSDINKSLDDLLTKLGLKDISNGDFLEKKIEKSLSENKNILNDWINLGIKSFGYFIKYNITGPIMDNLNPLKDNTINLLLNKKCETCKYFSLVDEINDNVVCLEFLYLSKIIFLTIKSLKEDLFVMWWLFRVNYVYQLILDEISNEILNENELIIEEINKLKTWAESNNDCLQILFNIEIVHFYLLYKRINMAEKYLKDAKNIAKLEIKLEGAMGLRTKYQVDKKPQLFLNVKLGRELFPCENCSELPQSVDLIDDLRLEKIRFSKEIEFFESGVIEESIILTECLFLQMSQPKDLLADEEAIPYLNFIINNTKNWPLKMEALRERSIMEIQDKRSIERALSQMECLVAQYIKLQPKMFYRSYNIFSSSLKPMWIFKQNLANAMLNLGMVKDALNLYLKIQLWEEVIVCYTILQLKHKAAEIIRQEISKKPTVKLWCLLGDAEQNVNHYEIAWKLSGEKSSRVQRHWGLYYFSKQNYVEAIPHLKLSVELNNIQENIWIRLGFAALQVDDWKLAARAYRHYCELDQTNFEAWNNLAKAYIKLGDKSRAWYAFQDAIKCDYEKWQIWDNFMICSIDLGHFNQVIKCYHRLLDLKDQHIDIQVLEILVNAISNDLFNSEGKSTKNLLPKALELFGRLTSIVRNQPEIWKLYAELTILNNTDIDYQKASQYLQKAYQFAVSDLHWFKNIDTVKNVLELCINLANIYLKCISNIPNPQKKNMLSSAKLSFQSVISKIKQEELDQDLNIVNILFNLENNLKIIVEKLETC